MFLKKYELFLQNLNQELSSGTFDVEKNEEKLQKVVSIYKLLQQKDYENVKKLIQELGFQDEEICEKKRASMVPGCPPAPAPVPQKSTSSVSKSLSWFFWFAKKDAFAEKEEMTQWVLAGSASAPSCNESMDFPSESNTLYRDWDIQTVHDEDNIEAFNSIEMMSAIFLKNLQEKIWTQK